MVQYLVRLITDFKKDNIGAVSTEYVVLLAATSLIAVGVGLNLQGKAQTAIDNIDIIASNDSGAGDKAGKGGKGGKAGKGGKGGKK